MSISKNSIITIICIVVPVFAIMYLVSNFVLLNGFESLEKKDTQRNLSRGVYAIDAKIQNLVGMTEDWSNWDDTYAYAQDGNQEYIVKNMSDYTFQTTGLNLIIIIDKDGRQLYGKAYDNSISQEVPIPSEFNSQIFQTKFFSNMKYNSGIVLTDDYPLIMVQKPILNSFGEGPEAGIIILGAFLDPATVESLSDTTHLALTIHSFDGSDNPDDFKTAWKNLAQSPDDFIQPFNDNTIAGYRVLNDIWGQPALIIRVVLEREIYSQGITTIRYLQFFLLIIGIILVLSFIIILKKKILSRIISLDSQVQDITRTNNKSKRTKITGEDELSHLSANINSMLVSLQQSDKQINLLYEQEKKHRQQLEEEARTKSRFIDVLAHELRTPLTPVILSIETLSELFSDNPDSLAAKVIKNTLKSAYSLKNRLEELLDMARFSRGGIKLNFEIIDTKKFLDHVASTYKPTLEQKQQQLVVQVAEGLPQIKADPSRLEQVILNLLSNASKYSKENTVITLSAGIMDSSVLIAVKDQGIGISSEEQQNLFVPYYRVEQDRQSYSGIGLGLAVSKKIIDAHKGQIWVESERGKGSTFKFTVPVNSGVAG